jgi:hypothetical protein
MRLGLLGLALVALLAPSIVSRDNGLAAVGSGCFALHPWGISNIPVVDDDWMREDDYDGLGCEV